MSFLTSFLLRFRENINMNQKRNISNESGKTFVLLYCLQLITKHY